MSDAPTEKLYEEAGMGRALPRGVRPAVLVVDLSCGFTDPVYAAGSDLTPVVEATRQVVDVARDGGATTSGCIRATAIDLMQHGFPALVPRECVGDRASGPAEANLFDIQAKYADVVPAEDALAYLVATAASRNGDET